VALQKQPVIINFQQGIDTKTDPYQLPVGKFLTMVNSVFDIAGRLTKRNGFKKLTTLPDDNQTTLTTLNNSLIATGTNLLNYSADTDTWINQGKIQPIGLDVTPLLRDSNNDISPDTAITSLGLTCLVYMTGANTSYYIISDSTTGQVIVPRTALPSTATNPRAFLLDKYFVITYTATVGGTSHLQYIAIPIAMPASPRAPVDIATTLNTLQAGYDGVVANDALYISWSDTGTIIRTALLSSTLILSSAINTAGHTADLVSVTADISGNSPIIWVTFWDSGSNNGYSMAFDSHLNSVLAPTQVITGIVIDEITSVATNGINTILYENFNDYASPYPTPVKSDYVSKVTISQVGVVAGPGVVLRSVGLASKAFTDSGVVYFIATYGEANQPTYFLVDDSGSVYMRLAYSNGGGYKPSQVLPSVSTINNVHMVAYEFKDFLATVNKGPTLNQPTNSPSLVPLNAIYTQTGINLAKFSINNSGQFSSEIANTLHLTGGQLWMYDGVRPVEHGFQVWPEDIQVTTAATGGLITAQEYNYVFTYEWTDNQGNLHRSAPSIPISVITTGAVSTNTLYVPTLRITDKISPNPVRIVGYRWSTAQQVYYQFTSITAPVLNNTAIDFVVITDTNADSAILGNTLLYTQGGVIENIAAPASTVSALFKNRLFIVDAEDRNLLWYSKQVIEAVPVEMSDLFTIYVAPTSGAQGSTGPITALSAMDDKLIIFKRDAIYYVTGTGPDNTGANNDFSDPIYITSSVGCANQASIVLMPNGIMFQSDKGIWLLDRSLGTQYIGAPVESFNAIPVKSAVSIPGTNQVRFILNNDVTLMYDYFYAQWGTFSNLRAISSTLYNQTQVYLNAFGQILQETPNYYLDDSKPVLMSVGTGPISVAGLRGFERFYFMYLLGTYITPFKLNVGISYDFSNNPSQTIQVTPDNYVPDWGLEALWGSNGPWGGPGNVFQARIFPERQKCQTFQININEIYDASYGVIAGQGLTLSGMNLVIGVKKGYSPQKASRSFG